MGEKEELGKGGRHRGWEAEGCLRGIRRHGLAHKGVEGRGVGREAYYKVKGGTERERGHLIGKGGSNKLLRHRRGEGGISTSGGMA